MRVLVAEDDPVVALGLTERLRSLGYEVIGPAANGREAVRLAQAESADLYVLDVEMPEIDGLEAAAQLTALGLRRPVVVVTGVEDPGLIARSITVGVAAYLTKPVDTLQLQAAIELAAARYEELERAQQALQDRKVVERAKGILMTALGLTEPEAFRRLQTTARENNLRLADVAARIVEQQQLLAPTRSS